MRTTLDIDNDVLQVAKEIAVARKQTAGQVISDLARQALARPSHSYKIEIRDGFPLMTGGKDNIVTSEMVERLLLEADLEDAGLAPE